MLCLILISPIIFLSKHIPSPSMMGLTMSNLVPPLSISESFSFYDCSNRVTSTSKTTPSFARSSSTFCLEMIIHIELGNIFQCTLCMLDKTSQSIPTRDIGNPYAVMLDIKDHVARLLNVPYRKHTEVFAQRRGNFSQSLKVH